MKGGRSLSGIKGDSSDMDMGKRPEGKYAWTATVGEKGQIVIPKQAREVFGIQPGDTLLLFGDVEHGIVIPPKNTFDQLLGAVFEKEEDQKG